METTRSTARILPFERLAQEPELAGPAIRVGIYSTNVNSQLRVVNFHTNKARKKLLFSRAGSEVRPKTPAEQTDLLHIH